VALAAQLNEPPDRRQELALPRLRVARRRKRGIRDSEEVEQHRQQLLEAVVEQQQAARDLVPGKAEFAASAANAPTTIALRPATPRRSI
jgi:hypothetical protein